jgi:hypothetical protein
MSPDTPISIDSAVSMMFESPAVTDGAEAAAEKPAAAAATADEKPAVAEDTPSAAADEDEEDETPEDASASSDQDPPADTGDTNDEGVDPGDALPPIEPPSSWTAEEKAEWNSLSRKAQETIQRREQDNAKALRTAQNSAADQRKAADAEVARLKGLASQIDGFINDKVAALQRDFPDIKSEADLLALSQSDPARYLAFDARIKAVASANQAKEAAAAEVAKVAQIEHAQMIAQAKEALLKEFPTWNDPTVARKELGEVQEYAIKQGAPEAAARATVDPLTIKLAHKAMLYDRAQAAKAKAVDKTPPRVIKPGSQSSTPKADAKAATRRSQLEKLDKSHDIADAVALMFE